MALLEVEHLTVRTVDDHQLINGVTFSLDQGENVGLVGWTGSGKTTIGKAVCGLLADNLVATGSVRIDGTEMLGVSQRRWRAARGRTCLFLPQDPLAALDPARRIAPQLREAFTVRGVKAGAKEIDARLSAMGLVDTARFLRSFPHQLSGGERQRILLSLIGIIQPRILIADEPTSAVDAVLKQRVVAELLDLKEQYGFGLLVITHDLHVMRRIGGRMMVLRGGQAVEVGPVSEVLQDPKADYTRELLAASTLQVAQGSM
jgi:peptide/nickel transport system ATP-binding protein